MKTLLLLGTLGLGPLAPPQQNSPPPPAKMESIPYCPTRPFGQPQVYYPCMYSGREWRA